MSHPDQPQPSPAVLLLEDGTFFEGTSRSPGTTVGEVVFNTSMTGYHEILTDPSYRGQIVVMTQPQIGNYGFADDEAESSRIWVEGFIARRFITAPSGKASHRRLTDHLRDQGIPCLEGIDTRALVRHLREKGAMMGIISTEIDDRDELQRRLEAVPPMEGRALVEDVTRSEPSRRQPEERKDGSEKAAPNFEVGSATPGSPGSSRLPRTEDEGEPVGESLHVALYDFGTKESIARALLERGARVTILPADTPASELESLGVDGVVLSNGPGDPAPLDENIQNIQRILESDRPVFGICLGHQLLALALGAKTFKLDFGHHGGNHPVSDLSSGKVWITSQNHGFAVDEDSLPPTCEVTHRNLNDQTIEGLSVRDRDVFSVQFHPEAAPGPHDGGPLFDRFFRRMRERRRKMAPTSS